MPYKDKDKQREYSRTPERRAQVKAARRRYDAREHSSDVTERDRASKRKYNSSDKGKASSARQDEKKREERRAAGGTHGGARARTRPTGTPQHRVSPRPKAPAASGRNPAPNTPAANRARVAAAQAREAARKRGRRRER